MEENDVGGEGGEHQEGPSEIEREAMTGGWEPQERWHGKPEDWVDAESFVRRGREINAVLKKTNAAQARELAAIKAELAQFKGTVAEMAEFRQDLEKKVYDRAMTDLRQQLKQAKIDGDIDREFDVQEAIEGMRDQKPKVKEAAAPVVATPVEPQEFRDWKARSPWYSADNPKMVSYADGVAMNVIKTIQNNEGRAPTAKEVLVAVDEAVRDMFPQAFSTRQASMVEGGGGGNGGPSGKGSKGFSSIPQTAKDQFEKFYKAGYYIDMATKKPLPKATAQAEYFKDYNGGE